jgi:transposase-like protein
VLLAFYDYPAEHWIHLRATDPIESTFATVRLRQRVTKGPGSRAAGVAKAFKLIESAQTGGGPSTHTTSSRWSVPARYSGTAGSSNDICPNLDTCAHPGQIVI